SFGFLLAVGGAVGQPVIVGAVGLFGLIGCLFSARLFLDHPDTQAQKRLDTMSGLWVVMCYGAAGFVPLLVKLCPGRPSFPAQRSPAAPAKSAARPRHCRRLCARDSKCRPSSP